MNGLALCAGAGGLELGLKLALGQRYRTVGYCERDAYAAAILVARMADAALDRAPVWDDLSTFAGSPWRGRVDLISGGFPCQPHSTAGRRRGLADDRWLWPQFARVIREVRPRLVFLENVPGLLTSGGFSAVLGDLAALGFDAEWLCHSAAAEGAPHRRERLWILAAHPGRVSARHRQQLRLGARDMAPVAHADGALLAVADANRVRLEQGRGPHEAEPHRERMEHETDADRRDAPGDLADPEGSRLEGSRLEGSHRQEPAGCGVGDAAGEGCSGREPEERPGSDAGGWWEAEPDVGRVADGVASWVDRLRATGNGVVPVVAARAFRELWRRLHGER